MRIVFAGTPPFAAAALAAMLGHRTSPRLELIGVLTQPDRPAGRGMKPVPSAVKVLALKHGLEVLSPPTLSLSRGGQNAEQVHDQLRALGPDLMVVAAYGLILPQAVLDIPTGVAAINDSRVRAINIHASLLPRWRGAAPVARAIAAGDTITGVTLMQMEAGLDTGPMLMTSVLPILLVDTTATLTPRLADLGAALLLTGLREAAFGRLRPQAQPAEGATYAHKLDKREASLNWHQSAAQLACLIRAYDPFPGASTHLCHSQQPAHATAVAIKLWMAQVVPATAALPETATDFGPTARAVQDDQPTPPPPGMVTRVGPQGVQVACGEHGTERLLLTVLQRHGGRRLLARDFLAGTPIKVGDRLQPFDAIAST